MPTRAVSFRPGDERCAGVLVLPEGDGPFPCVVAAHGFGALKEGGPVRVVERFAEYGIAGLAFDYRHWGESGGEPRELLDIGRQHDDYRAAIEFARGLEEVDPERVAVWGSSFSGGHVVAVAAADDRLAAAISQAPHMSGIATVLNLEPRAAVRGLLPALRDQLAALRGREPVYVGIVAEPGGLAAMTTPGALAGFAGIYDEGFEWPNRVAARIGLRLGSYSPGRRASRVRCPLLVLVAGDDEVTPPEAAIKAAGRAPRGELVTYAGLRHFDLYRGEPFERAMADQLAFLREHLL